MRKHIKININKNKKQKRVRKQKTKSAFKKSIRFLGVNAAGIKSKMNSFKNVLKELRPSVFFIEETKLKEPGHFKVENYDIFELVRESQNGGGGLAIGCVKEVHAALVKEGDDRVEALSVDIFVKNFKIRCCVAYGCQESDTEDRKDAFWQYLEEEVSNAEESDAGFVLHMDGNLWAGDDIIPGDPRKQNRNGKKFQNFLEHHPNLTVVNSLPLCKGLITRSRNKDGKYENSVLDFFVVCNRVLPYVIEMKIDEEKEHVLTNYKRVKVDGKATDSDHNTLYMDLDFEIEDSNPKRKEIFNFKSKEGQEKFKQLTSGNEKFTKCFQTNAPLKIQIENWREALRSACKEAFPKIRIKKRKNIQINAQLSKLIKQRNFLTANYVDKNEEIKKLEEIISSIEAEENRKKILNNFKYFSENPEMIEMSKMWKLLKKIWPKYESKSTAKKNYKGEIISNPSDLKVLLAQEYKERLRKRPMKIEMKSIMIEKQKIFNMKINLAINNKSPDWSLKELEQALDNLKNNKSRDCEGFSNEIFKQSVIGTNLKMSLLVMFNKMKENSLIPKFFNFANVTTVPKKGSRLILANERGIFRVSVIRSILMNMIYERNYSKIDNNMSDCQMGGRRQKSCKNNIFILNGVIHDVMTSRNSQPIVIQFYDYCQMFDSINLQEAISDIYDLGLDNDTLDLIYKSNSEISMAVKTTHGLTERQMITDTVLQGDKFGSLLASVMVEKIGQECMKAGYFYSYKNSHPVGFLGMVDDTVGITHAGYKANQLNSFMNVKSAEKTLQFGPSKCQYMVVGKNSKKVTQNKLNVDHWVKEYKQDANSKEISLFEYYGGKLDMKQTNEYKYLGFMISHTGENMVNIKKMRQKSIGIIRKIISKLKSLNLKQYYFECSVVLMNVMLRGTILYAADTYYNLKETEMRQIERIEEEYMRKILRTTRGCPIVSLYLSLGQIPARFVIQKMRLMYMKYILEQPAESSISRIFSLQLEKPKRGDWASSCLNDMEKLNIKLTFEEIRSIKKTKFMKILKEKVRDAALKYLLEKQGKKGREINFSYLDMADYLLPFNNKQTIEQKCEMFAVKNSMINIPANFSSNCETKCECGVKEDMVHIYNCELYNNRKPEIPFEKIFNGNMKEQILVFNKFSQNMETRKKLKQISYPSDQCDPLLYSLRD